VLLTFIGIDILQNHGPFLVFPCIFLCLRHQFGSSVCDVTEPAKISIRRMWILCAKSVGCRCGLVVRSKLVPAIIATAIHLSYLQVAQLLQSDCAAGCISFGQKWKTGTGTQYFKDIIGLFSTTVT